MINDNPHPGLKAMEKLSSSQLGDSGSDVVLLHGWGRSRADFKPLSELLAWKHKVHLIDLPGFGRSAAPPADWGTHDYAQCILNYLDKHNINRAHFVGHSFGGRISLRLAAKHPERVISLSLIGSHGLQLAQPFLRSLRSRWIAALRSIIKWSDAQFGTTWFKGWFVPKFGSRDYLAAGELRGTLVKTVTEDQTANCRKIQAPTLLLWGSRDTETPLALGERFRELISGAKLIVLQGQDHYPFKDVGSHLIAHYLLPFLAEAEAQNLEEAA